MPRNPALSEALTLASSRRAECDVTIAEATRALDNAESALSALGTAALIVDVRAQRDRWDAIAGELRGMVGEDAPIHGAIMGAYVGAVIGTSTVPAGERGKVCPECNGTGWHRFGGMVNECATCNGSGYVEIR